MSSPRGTLPPSLAARPLLLQSDRQEGPLDGGWRPAAKNVIGNQRHIPADGKVIESVINRINFVSMDPFIAVVLLCQKGSRRRYQHRKEGNA